LSVNELVLKKLVVALRLNESKFVGLN